MEVTEGNDSQEKEDSAETIWRDQATQIPG